MDERYFWGIVFGLLLLFCVVVMNGILQKNRHKEILLRDCLRRNEPIEKCKEIVK